MRNGIVGDDEIVEADPTTRWIAIASLVLGALLIPFSSLLARFMTFSIDTSDFPSAMAQLNLRHKIFTVALVIPLLLLAGSLCRRGLLTIRARAYPPPGVKSPWRVRRQQGTSAWWVGLWHLVMSSLFFIHACIAFWLVFR
jgi:hypothetical protein